MRLYIAGPMTGKKLYNFPMFMRAQMVLRMMGYGVCCPAENDIQRKFVVWDSEFKRIVIAHPIEEIKAHNLTAARGCEGFVLLPGWETSAGACEELRKTRFEERAAYSGEKAKRYERTDLRYFLWDDEWMSITEIPWKLVNRQL